MGFSMSRVMNPETGTAQTTAMAQLFEIMGFMLIFQLNLHHKMLRDPARSRPTTLAADRVSRSTSA